MIKNLKILNKEVAYSV